MRKDEDRANRRTDDETVAPTPDEQRAAVKIAEEHIERHREAFEELAKR